VYGTVMTATGSIVAFCYLNLFAVITNVIMNLLLIPSYGALGCCISALCSQFLLGLSTMIFIHRKMRMDPDTRSLVFYLLNGLVICAVLYVLMKTSMNSLLIIPAVALISFLVMWMSKMISINSWLSFIKKQ